MSKDQITKWIMPTLTVMGLVVGIALSHASTAAQATQAKDQIQDHIKDTKLERGEITVEYRREMSCLEKKIDEQTRTLGIIEARLSDLMVKMARVETKLESLRSSP